MRGTSKIAASMLDLIGDIPLVRLNRVGKETGSEFLAKPEYLNPSGSIKDRIAKRMIEDAERKGLLKEGGVIIDATTGNTGTALAFVAAVKGYKMIAFAPGQVTDRTKVGILTAYGAELRMVDIESYQAEARSKGKDSGEASVHGGFVELLPRQICLEMERERHDTWWARQFSNPSNTAAHREWTAREILEQTDGKLDAFVTSIGTGGTLLGIAQALKAHDPRIAVVSVEPASWPVLGVMDEYPIIPGISDGILVEIVKSGLVDRVMAITNEEAVGMAHLLAEKEGMFCGMSSGANMVAALRFAEELGPGKRIVVILPDSRDRYLFSETYTT